MVLEIHNLVAGYGGLEVLHGTSLHVDEGEMVALIGPNGAGKSTVLKSIFGLADRASGQILFQGKDVTQLPTHALLEEGMGFVPQGRLVFSSMTVEENLEMGGYLLNHTETRRQNLDHVYARFPALADKRRERAAHLSGGQQQQLAIGRALMMSPQLLLLDEPSLGLSPKLMAEVFQKLDEIRAEGTALLVVEQNVRLALAHANRGYLLAAGTVCVSGSAKELSRPGLMQEAYLR
ncbi:ABC transporter ATP-binding protein [Candidatus Uhrbacteria bacterium]|nr:ABC transporter ATP-binding protein [Candidatus Uhrbacteria bacterium]